MKVDLLRIIEDALIGGRYGEMAYIENNPFVSTLFREYTNRTNGDFSDFLRECIDGKDFEEEAPQIKSKHSVIEKRVGIDKYKLEEWKKYQEAKKELSKANNNLLKAEKELAIAVDETLYKISDYKVCYGEYSTYMKYTIQTKDIEVQNV